MSVKSSDLVFVNCEDEPPAHSNVKDGVCLEVEETVKSDNILTDSGYSDPPHNSQEEDHNSLEVKEGIAASTNGNEIKDLKPFVKLERLPLNDCKSEETFKCKLLNLVPTLDTESKSKLSIDHPTKLEASSFPGVVNYVTKKPLSKSKGSDTNKLYFGYKFHNLTYPVTSSAAFRNKMEIKRMNPVVLLERLPSCDTSSETSSSSLHINNIHVVEETGNMLDDQQLPDSR